MENLFPTKLAKGAAFCNRVEELKRLRFNLGTTNPTLIKSPRRYGKTSLALRAFEQISWPFVRVDLYKAFSEKDIERFILNGIASLLAKIETAPNKLLKLAASFFSNLQINVSIGTNGLNLEFQNQKKTASDNILLALEKLHELAKKRKKKVILYLDEFQVLGSVCPNYAIEAAIREVAQNSDYIAFIFSGSERHLIEEQFNDNKRPFYKLCDTINLSRIASEEYKLHLKKASIKKWNKPLSKEAVEAILYCTENHAYYLNKLCSILWLGDYPSVKRISEVWFNFSLENKSTTERELSLLPVNQRKILTLLAEENGVDEPFSQYNLKKKDLSNSSASHAMGVLLKKDYVIHDENGCYKILDPLIKNILSADFTL